MNALFCLEHVMYTEKRRWFQFQRLRDLQSSTFRKANLEIFSKPNLFNLKDLYFAQETILTAKMKKVYSYA